MALRARSALAERGLGPSGLAVAITPCRYKRLETKAGNPYFAVIQLNELLGAAKAAGEDPFAYRAAAYDEEIPPADLACRIGAEVVRELTGISIGARAVKLDGAEEAATFLSDYRSREEKGISAPGVETLVIEMTFCKGGCSVPPIDAKSAVA